MTEIVYSLVPDDIWPAKNRDEMLKVLAKQGREPLQTRDDLWNLANFVFGPGMYHIDIMSPPFTTALDGSRIYTIKIFLQVYAKSKWTFCPQEMVTRFILPPGSSATDEIAALQQAEDEALFQVFATYGPYFQRSTPTIQPPEPPQREPEGSFTIVPPTPRQEPTPLMPEKTLARERTAHFTNLCTVFKDQEEMNIFLALVGLSERQDEWTEQQMLQLPKHIKSWCAPITEDHPVGRENWNQTPMLEAQREQIAKIAALFSTRAAANEFVRKHREPLGFTSIKNMNAGWGARLIQILQADLEYITLATATQRKTA